MIKFYSVPEINNANLILLFISKEKLEKFVTSKILPF